ncbi:MAG: (Fe-S)-binding protein [Chromatiales bacterium]|nr:(Fe-S)-binding protein [Gammaproteobacteria bacterium]MBW6475973.1 (Fe-S)-binding protein [Chromatiales bacterium]
MSPTLTDSLLAATDRCVMCGQCLPHCPSYQLWHNEADSPRGRIALLQALGHGQLAAGPGMLRHLDRCLGCLACERMCPSLVEYGQILDQGRALLHPTHPPARPVQQLLDSVSDLPGMARQASMLRLYQRSGLQRLARRSGALKVLGLAEQEAALPPIPKATKLASHYPALGEAHGRVALFTGCVGQIFDGAVHQAAIAVLTRLGFAVTIPTSQGCCGALHQHNGEPEQAAALARRNIDSFSDVDAVIGCATGCGAQLHQYQGLYGEGLKAPFFDVAEFIIRHWPGDLPLHPVPQRALYHLPCSQRNVLRQPDSTAQLLAPIPELALSPLPGNDSCCGAAGSFLLSQPEAAAALREPKLAAIAKAQPDVLLSSNTSCALHLRQGLLAQGIAIPVRHPIELLAEALLQGEQGIAP